jgi:hypothetical protein
MAKELQQEYEATLQARANAVAELPREVQELDARLARLRERLKNWTS